MPSPTTNTRNMAFANHWLTKVGVSLLFGSLTLHSWGEGTEEARVLLWGDTHLHTSYSFDAFLNGNQSADPDVAYRYAKGIPVIHPYNRTRVQIQTPLDFLVVSDHAEFYGGIRDIYLSGIQNPDPNIIERLAYWYTEGQIRDAIDTGTGPEFFRDLLPTEQDPYTAASEWVESNQQNSVPGADVSLKNAWQRMLDSAAAHHIPGEFTTIIGWEWSTIPGGANLHRVVMTDASPEQAAGFLPFSSIDSPFPQDLWQWMAATSEQINARFLAIPHNSNISKGVMFDEITLRREPIDAEYAQLRLAAEPVVEITQIKGDSETHPDLSPDDEFADFETYPWYIARNRPDSYTASEGDFVRSALKRGLQMEEEIGKNPYQFGVVGSTDSHTSLSSAEEPNFWGKMAFDSVPERKTGNALGIGPSGWSMQAGGLAAVWAKENSRTAIVDAFMRREVYGTTGPRIRLQFTASSGTADAAELARMGGAITAPETAPVFNVTAMKDPVSANLDRIQIVKGWVDSDGSHEQIYNIAWSGERQLQDDGRLPAVGDTVDRTTGQYTNTIGADTLQAAWQDPDYDASQRAFYYVRVLEIPTPRHALLDALALGMEAPTEGTEVIQERAYSSAIWLTPAET